MRLYAKVKSDRASKGQGGNKFISVAFTIGSAKQPNNIATVTLERNADTGLIELYWTGDPTNWSHALLGEWSDTESYKESIRHDPRTCENSVPCLECEQRSQEEPESDDCKFEKTKGNKQ